MKQHNKQKTRQSLINVLMLISYVGIGVLNHFWNFGTFFIVWALFLILIVFILFSRTLKSKNTDSVENAVNRYKSNKVLENEKKNSLLKRYINYNQSYSSNIISDKDDSEQNHI